MLGLAEGQYWTRAEDDLGALKLEDLDRAAEAVPRLQVALEQLLAQREWRYLSLASYARISLANAAASTPC